jgi:uncharacterized protein (TIGR00299 family) protein
MKVAYFDAFSGLSGDMVVGALLDCGLEISDLERQLATLGIGGYRVRREARERSGIRATKFVVDIDDHSRRRSTHRHPHGSHAHRSFRDVRERIRQSSLAPRVRKMALEVFVRLAEAEGKVHGVEPDQVTFHEVGAIDSIVDVVGAAWGVDALGIEDIVVSPLPLGGGFVRTAHGPLPVPGPATVELLRGFPVRVGDGAGELVTPTGAAIVAALGRPGNLPQSMRVERIGYGAGEREVADRPNLLRVLVGVGDSAAGVDSLLVLETNLDDFNPELYGHVMERLFTDGARDVFFTPIHMKKNRPGVLLSVLADPDRRDRLAATLFAETSTLGVRVHSVERLRIQREGREIETRYGRVRVKLGHDLEGYVNVSPEYEDCRRVAVANGVPLKVVYQEAAAAALGELRATVPAARRRRARTRARTRG